MLDNSHDLPPVALCTSQSNLRWMFSKDAGLLGLQGYWSALTVLEMTRIVLHSTTRAVL